MTEIEIDARIINNRFIKVYLDLENFNGCWNCKHDRSICKIHNIGSVGYVKGISHCALENWEHDKDAIKLTLKANKLIDKKIKEYQNHLRDIQNEEFCPDRYIHETEGKLAILKELKKEVLNE